MAPNSEKSSPMGRRRSSLMAASEERKVEQGHGHEDHRAEVTRPFVPRQVTLGVTLGQTVHETTQLFVALEPLRHEADENRHREARRPRPDGGPEVLCHL